MPAEPLSHSNLSDAIDIEALSPGTSWSDEKLQSVFESAYMSGIVWRESGKACGYAVYGLVAPTLEILNIVVHPDCRRQGIARKLLAWVFEEAHQQKCTEVFLEVRVSNTAAIQLYESLQFSIVHTRKSYYPDGEDGLVMRAALS